MTAAKSQRKTARALDPTRRATHGEIFAAFFKIGLCGFGGVAGWVRPVIVEERSWLNDCEFAELLGAANVLPGANTVNLAVMLGDRFQGPSGAATAVFALMLAPLAILIGVASLYDQFASDPAVKSALAGAAAATAGLVIANAYKLLLALRGDRAAMLVAALTFAAAGILHLSLPAILTVAVPASIALYAFNGRRP
jgi:chromate transporter